MAEVVAVSEDEELAAVESMAAGEQLEVAAEPADPVSEGVVEPSAELEAWDPGHPVVNTLAGTTLLVAGGIALAAIALTAQRAPAPVLARAPIVQTVPLPQTTSVAPPTSSLIHPPDLPARSDRPTEAVAGQRFVAEAPRPIIGGRPVPPAGPYASPQSLSLGSPGPVPGPVWARKPLPAVIPGRGGVMPVPASPEERPPSPLSSELPDPKALALSQLANPAPQVRTAGAKPEPGAPTAEKPFSVRISVGRGGKAAHAGDLVPVHVSASTPGYIAIVRVDTAGHAVTLFRSPAPSRSVSVAVKAGPTAGREYLLAVASARPLAGKELSSSLRGSGGFAAAGNAEGSSSGAAWSVAVGQVADLGSGSGAARYEWDFATASYIVLAAPKPAAPSKPAAPARPDASALPGATTTPTTPPVTPAKKSDPAPPTPPASGSEVTAPLARPADAAPSAPADPSKPAQ